MQSKVRARSPLCVVAMCGSWQHIPAWLFWLLVCLGSALLLALLELGCTLTQWACILLILCHLLQQKKQIEIEKLECSGQPMHWLCADASRP